MEEQDKKEKNEEAAEPETTESSAINAEENSENNEADGGEEKREPESGEVREEKRPDPQIRFGEQSGFLKWLDNFWYHYKWQTILVAFFLLTVIVCLVQCSSNEKTDMIVTYGGNYRLNQQESKAIGQVLDQILPEDFDGDGDKKVAFADYSFFTEKELEEQAKYFDAEKQEYLVDLSVLSGYKNQNLQEYQTISTYVKTGDCALWFISPTLYKELELSHLSVCKTGIGGETVLGETEFYQYYEVMQVLPADTLLVVTDSYFTDDAVEESALAMYQAIISFRKP